MLRDLAWFINSHGAWVVIGLIIFPTAAWVSSKSQTDVGDALTAVFFISAILCLLLWLNTMLTVGYIFYDF
jgi:hypothetical protein